MSCDRKIGPFDCCSVVQGDCLELMKQLPDGCVDAVITDPPYSNRTHAGHDASARGHAGFGKDNADRRELDYTALTEQQVVSTGEQFNRVCSGWVVWMTDHVLAPQIMKSLEASGRYVFAPLPFYAPGSRCRLSGDGPSSWTIWIVVARTAKQLRWGTLPGGYMSGSGWSDSEITGGKPTLLMQELVGDYSRKSGVVLDAYCGAGTTLVAAKSSGRHFLGFDIDEQRCAHSRKRLALVEAQPTLFEKKPEQMTL